MYCILNACFQMTLPQFITHGGFTSIISWKSHLATVMSSVSVHHGHWWSWWHALESFPSFSKHFWHFQVVSSIQCANFLIISCLVITQVFCDFKKLRKSVHRYLYECNPYMCANWWLSSGEYHGLAQVSALFLTWQGIFGIFSPLLAFREEWMKFMWHLNGMRWRLPQTPHCHHEIWRGNTTASTRLICRSRNANSFSWRKVKLKANMHLFTRTSHFDSLLKKFATFAHSKYFSC